MAGSVTRCSTPWRTLYCLNPAYGPSGHKKKPSPQGLTWLVHSKRYENISSWFHFQHMFGRVVKGSCSLSWGPGFDPCLRIRRKCTALCRHKWVTFLHLLQNISEICIQQIVQTLLKNTHRLYASITQNYTEFAKLRKCFHQNNAKLHKIKQTHQVNVHKIAQN